MTNGLGRPRRSEGVQPTPPLVIIAQGHKPKRPDRPAPPGPVIVTPVPVPPPVLPAGQRGLEDLTGTVRTMRPNSVAPFDIPWQRVVDVAGLFDAETRASNLPPYLLPAMAVIESDVRQTLNGVVIEVYDRFGGGPSVGMMQIKPFYWQSLDREADAYTVAGNIHLAALLMRASIDEFGTWQQAIMQRYHPGTSGAGTTPQDYVETAVSLIAEQANQLQPIPAPAPPQPVDPVEPVDVIMRGVPWHVEYGFRDDVGLNYYGYGVGHGTSAATQHTGDDVLVPDETPFSAPLDGRITCVGAVGEVTWGQGCGYYNDETADQGHGAQHVGNITLLTDRGIKIVFGHSSQAVVKYGDRVKAGDQLGYTGGMNGWHQHLEVAIDRNGYWLMDPQPALREAMGGKAPIVYAERQPVAQPAELDHFVTVHVTQDGLPILQFANKDAAPVSEPFKAGETFQAAQLQYGDDGLWYWIGANRGRVPILGTATTEGPIIARQ